MLKVSDLMSPNPYACSPNDTLATAGWLMWDNDIGVVPVVDETERVIGVLTDRDLAMAVVLRSAAPTHLRVADAMTTNVATCGPDDDVALAEQLMSSRQVRRIPVVDGDGRLVGLLSMNDLAMSLARRGGRGVPAEHVARTLRAVSRPRRALAELEAKAG